MVKEHFNNDIERNGFNQFGSGGMGESQYCFPSHIGDFFMIVLFPPLFVFFKEKKDNFKRFTRIIYCLLLTCMFYFPGVIYALKVFREEGASDGTTYDPGPDANTQPVS